MTPITATLQRATTAALALAGGILLAGCGPMTGPNEADQDGYSIDVFATELETGSCIESSWNGDERSDPFDFSANYFRVVNCEREHAAQVLGKVDIPAADEWAFYGTTDGPSQVEADAWLHGVCASYAVLVDSHLGETLVAEATVEPVYGLLGDNQLGFCLLYTADEGGLDQVVDLDELVAASLRLGFDVGVPSISGWLVPPATGASVFWADLRAGQCVDPYSGPDMEEYTVVDCSGPHAAQLVAWIELAPEWNGVYPGFDIAQPYAVEACQALAPGGGTGTDAPVIQYETSETAEEYIVDDRYLAMCWARA